MAESEIEVKIEVNLENENSEMIDSHAETPKLCRLKKCGCNKSKLIFHYVRIRQKQVVK